MTSLKKDTGLCCAGHSHAELALTAPTLAKAEAISGTAGVSLG